MGLVVIIVLAVASHYYCSPQQFDCFQFFNQITRLKMFLIPVCPCVNLF